MWQPAAVAIRAAVILILAVGLVAAGALVDRLTGAGPIGTLSALVVAVIGGTVMILAIVIGSFPRPVNRKDANSPAKRKPES